jgi:hypothetical protein
MIPMVQVVLAPSVVRNLSKFSFQDIEMVLLSRI